MDSRSSEQRVETGGDRIKWECRVNEYLKLGWRVVPGTIQISSTWNPIFNEVQHALVVVLER